MFDDFNSDLTAEEMYGEDFNSVCGYCGTDHSDPDDESACYAAQQDDEPFDIDDDHDVNPYDGTYDWMQDQYDSSDDFF